MLAAIDNAPRAKKWRRVDDSPCDLLSSFILIVPLLNRYMKRFRQEETGAFSDRHRAHIHVFASQVGVSARLFTRAVFQGPTDRPPCRAMFFFFV